MPLKYPSIKVEDFVIGDTLGTGSFGRVRLAEYKKHDPKSKDPKFFALKILKKIEVLSSAARALERARRTLSPLWSNLCTPSRVARSATCPAPSSRSARLLCSLIPNIVVQAPSLSLSLSRLQLARSLLICSRGEYVRAPCRAR